MTFNQGDPMPLIVNVFVIGCLMSWGWALRGWWDKRKERKERPYCTTVRCPVHQWMRIAAPSADACLALAAAWDAEHAHCDSGTS